MHHRLLRFTTISVMLALAATHVSAQKHSKRRALDAHNTVQSTKSSTQPAQAADLSSPPPNQARVSPQSTLAPEIRKTKKVVIVPAPPPPPGKDPVPPKR